MRSCSDALINFPSLFFFKCDYWFWIRLLISCSWSSHCPEQSSRYQYHFISEDWKHWFNFYLVICFLLNGAVLILNMLFFWPHTCVFELCHCVHKTLQYLQRTCLGLLQYSFNWMRDSLQMRSIDNRCFATLWWFALSH